jgi:hypothetical protein
MLFSAGLGDLSCCINGDIVVLLGRNSRNVIIWVEKNPEM